MLDRLSKMNDTIIAEEFRNISPERIDQVCKDAEKLIGGEYPGDQSDEDPAVRSLLSIVTSLMRENKRKDAVQHFLEDVFSNPEVIEAVKTWYGAVSSRLRSVLHRDLSLSGGGLNFKDLDWRLEATLASRCQRTRCDPRLSLRLTLEDDQRLETSVDLRCEVKTLETIVTSLEEAAAEANSPLVRRLMKKYNV